MTTISISIKNVAAVATTARTRVAASNDRFVLPPAGMPLAIAADELYFWTAKWRADEAEAAAEYRQGRARRFDSGTDAARSLFRNDD